VDYEEELFDDEEYEVDEEEEENDEDENNEMYDDIDENEIADIMEETNQFNIPHEMEQNNELIEEDENEEEDIVEVNEDDEDNLDEAIEDQEASEDHEDIPSLRRSTRVRVPNPRYQHLQTTMDQEEQYTLDSARIIATTIVHYNLMMAGMSTNDAYNFIQTYSLKQGLKKFGDRGKAAALKEMKQLHDRTVFEPIHVHEMTTIERKRAMESLIFLTEKRDETIKARTCANGSTQRDYIPKEEATSPTAATESILITGVVDAKQKRDVMTLDVPNAFVQTPIPKKGEKIIMKIRGQLVDILVEMCPEIYAPYVVHEGKHKQKVLYVRMLKALYGMLISSVLYYKKFRKDIESVGFKVNPYDICVANRTVNGKQHTVTWHIDDLKSSHVDPKVNDDFHAWCEKMYGGESGKVKVVRGKEHDYLAMILDYSQEGALKVNMKYYIDAMIKEFPHEIKANTTTPWTERLLKVDKNSKKLDEERKRTFHTFVMKCMFLCKPVD